MKKIAGTILARPYGFLVERRNRFSVRVYSENTEDYLGEVKEIARKFFPQGGTLRLEQHTELPCPRFDSLGWTRESRGYSSVSVIVDSYHVFA